VAAIVVVVIAIAAEIAVAVAAAIIAAAIEANKQINLSHSNSGERFSFLVRSHSAYCVEREKGITHYAPRNTFLVS
jgi:hypothetical protein